MRSFFERVLQQVTSWPRAVIGIVALLVTLIIIGLVAIVVQQIIPSAPFFNAAVEQDEAEMKMQSLEQVKAEAVRQGVRPISDADKMRIMQSVGNAPVQ